ncbi:MAG TPA: recombination mediator RecR [Moraxellaceae bacterium]|nr:recombination mediator RecR [Moraxellaceae bacterium]
MFLSPLVTELVEALRVLPGVGPKSAQRMALFLLERNREGGRRLAEVLSRAMDNVRECQRCQTLSDTELCRICSGTGRDHSLLCVVENPVDQIAIESSGSFRGLYFVLKGHLSPLDGIGPRELGIPALLARVREGEVRELILATNPTVEGEATAHYLREALRDLSGLTVSRIAHGVPMGGELEFVDGNTLAHALAGRKALG